MQVMDLYLLLKIINVESLLSPFPGFVFSHRCDTATNQKALAAAKGCLKLTAPLNVEDRISDRKTPAKIGSA